MNMAQLIEITIGETDFEFNVTDKAYNKFVDSMAKGQTVLPAYNLLSSTVKSEQHGALKRLMVNDDSQPKAKLVMDVMGILTDEFSSDLPAVVKLRRRSANESKETVTSNS